MIFHDAVNKGKPHACSLGSLFCREEGLKDMLHSMSNHTLARIAHSKPVGGNRIQVGMQGCATLIDLHARQAHLQQSVFFSHGVGRVGTKVYEDLVDVGEIGYHYLRGMIIDVYPKLNGSKQRSLEEFRGVSFITCVILMGSNFSSFQLTKADAIRSV